MRSTFDKEIVTEIFRNILWSLQQIRKRFAIIRTAEDFTKNDDGLEKLDSICMQLINIGEALKQVDTITNPELLVKYPGVDWKRAKGMRDIITHHYFDIDAEIVFSVCSEHLPAMETIVNRILEDLRD